jgi:MscS family membrane protein
MLGVWMENVFLNDYFRAILILIGSLVLAKLILFFFKHYLEQFFEKKEKSVKKRLFTKIELPIIIIIILVGFQLSLNQIIESHHVFENSVNTIIVFVVTFMFIGIISILLNYLKKTHDLEEKSDIHDEIFPLIDSLSKILLILIAVILTLQIWGVQIITLLASLGVAGVILGFAFKDSMVNIFGGIALIGDKSFSKKDIIQLDTGETGEVVEIGLRSTKIKTFDNEFLIVPNGLLANTKFKNFALPTTILRVVIPVTVAYGSDVEVVRETLFNALRGKDDILNYPRREVRLIKLADHGLDFELIFFISDYKNKFTMINAVTTCVYNELNRNGIEIPYPTRTVFTSPRPKHKRMVTLKELEREKMSKISKSKPKAIQRKKTVSKKKISKKKV